MHGRVWLLPLGLLLAAFTPLLRPTVARRNRANGLIALGAIGFLYLALQGFAIGPRGVVLESLSGMPGLSVGQYGIGLGATLTATAFAMLFSVGLAEGGFFKGDAFVAGSVVAVALLVTTFTFFPVMKILV